jgi:hypothetical protein
MWSVQIQNLWVLFYVQETSVHIMKARCSRRGLEGSGGLLALPGSGVGVPVSMGSVSAHSG